MKLLPRHLLVCLIIFVYSSCQKEPAPLTEPPVTGDSTKLVKYIIINNAVADTIFTSFDYDAQKRVTLVKSVYSSDPVDNSQFYSINRFQYSGADTLPNIITTEHHEGTAQDYYAANDTSYFSYDNLGRIIKDSTNYHETWSSTGTDAYYTTRMYSYTGNEITLKIKTNSKYAGLKEYTIPVTATEGNGNISALKMDDDYNINLTYDGHPNPFYYIPAFRSFTSIITSVVEGEIIYPVNTMQKNNCTGYSATYVSGDTENEVNTYTYTTNGLPATFTSQYSSNFGDPPTASFKGIFEYGKW